MRKNKGTALIGALLAVGISAGSALAIPLYDNKVAKLDFSIEAGAAAFRVDNDNFGGGQDYNPATQNDRDVNWREFYALPKLAGSYALDSSTFYGDYAYAMKATRGDGDGAGLVVGNQTDGRTETLAFGWKSGSVFPSLGTDGLDIYAGRGRLVIGNGYLVGDGVSDRGGMGCTWTAPHSSFRKLAVAHVNTKPVRGDLFFVNTDGTLGDTSAWGINLEYITDKYGTLGGMFMTVTDSESGFRDGMNVGELRYNGNFLSALNENFNFTFEYAFEKNTDNVYELDASAYAFEAAYNLPWYSSVVSIRFSKYSGDDLSTATNENFDSLFQKGFAGGWGTWLEGEIMGEYFYSNSNKESIKLGLKTVPFEPLTLHLLYFFFDTAEKNVYGTPVKSKNLGKELNICADWTVTQNLLLNFVYGRSWPGAALKEQGYDKTANLFQVAAIVNF